MCHSDVRSAEFLGEDQASTPTAFARHPFAWDLGRAPPARVLRSVMVSSRERPEGDAQGAVQVGAHTQEGSRERGVAGARASCCPPSAWLGGAGLRPASRRRGWGLAGGARSGRGLPPRSRRGALPSQAAGRPRRRLGRGDGGALILTGAARLWNEGRRRPPARPVRSVLGPERSRAQRARPRQRGRVREGDCARRSQRPDMPRTRGRCTPAAAARRQPARRPHARVPPRRAARGLRPGPSARGQQ